MPGFVPGMHAFFSYKSKTWMASEVELARLPHWTGCKSGRL